MTVEKTFGNGLKRREMINEKIPTNVDPSPRTLEHGMEEDVGSGGATVVVLAIASSSGGSYEDGAVGSAIALCGLG